METRDISFFSRDQFNGTPLFTKTSGEGWEESSWGNHPILVQIRSQSEFEKILIDRIYIPLRKRQAWVYKKG
jgi:hypothetical protein